MSKEKVIYGIYDDDDVILDAVKSISLNTAKILRIDNLVGSIEKDKQATFFISSGDALDMRSNNIEKAYIKGKEVDLIDHQKLLYKKYKKN